MKIKNTKNVTFQTHVINAAIVAVKLPNLGNAEKGWKSQKARLNGEETVLQYNPKRPTGVYFVYNGNVNYTKDRAMLESKSFTIVERAKAIPAPEAAEAPAPAAEAPAPAAE